MLEPEFIYFTDPMCSWCYGFAPIIRTILTQFSAIPMRIVPGGLRPHETEPLPEQMAATIQHHWVSVQETTGQPFKFGFFESHPAFVYNTLAPCRGIVAAGQIDPAKALPYLEQIQSRFYAQGEDPTTLQGLTQTAVDVGIPKEQFESALRDPATETALVDGMRQFQEIGAMGFPTLLLRKGDRKRLVTIGYQSFEHLEKVIGSHLEEMKNDTPRNA